MRLLPLLVFLMPPLSSPGTTAQFAPTLSRVDAADGDQDEGQQETTKSKKRAQKKDLPLEPARAISFPTEEASWMSLDVSPDGKTIIFDLLGDLYLLPLEGGEAQVLSKGMAFDAMPRFSPDGKTIVFVSDRSGGQNLWTIELESKHAKQITKGNNSHYVSPEWSPDGKYIVASKATRLFGTAKLWMWHVDGGTGIALIKDSGTGRNALKTLGAAFTPDGRRIWYAQRRGDWQYNAIFPQYQLAYYDRDRGRSFTRTSQYGSAFRPTLSPDGKWLVYGTRHDVHTGLRLRELATGEERWLAYPVQRDDQESRCTLDVLPGMSFTPDSKELVVSYSGRIWRVPIDGTAAKEVPFSANVALQIGPKLDFRYPVDDEPEFTVRQIRDTVPSPDGKRLAFIAMDRLYVMDYPGGEPKASISMNVVQAHPVWSPDGAWIAFATWSESEGGHLYKVSATDPAEPHRLSTTAAFYQQPAWSPDGKRIVAIRRPARANRVGADRGGPSDLVWLPSDGGEAVLIAPAAGRTAPHFVKHSDRIYLYSSARGLVSIRFDGTDEKQHLKVTGPAAPGARSSGPPGASLILMAPEGDRALAQIRYDLYVVTVPDVGGAAPTISVANPNNAAFPARRLTTIGAQFPAWSGDGKSVHWSIGNAHFVYDIEAAKTSEEKAANEKETKDARKDADESEEQDGTEKQQDGDQDKAEKPEESKDKQAGRYKPQEVRITIKARRDIPKGVAVLRGARAITMAGAEIIENADIVISNRRIQAIGPVGEVEVPEGATVIDLTGKTIIPGFVDTHAHLRVARGIHKSQTWSYLANLAYGVTTTRDPQTGTTDVLTYGDLVEGGAMLGPRIYSTGPGIFSTEAIKDLDHARNILRRYSDYYDTQTIKMYMTGNRQQRQWVVMAAKELKLKPTCEGGLDYQYDLTLMLDGYPGLEHALPIVPLYKDVVRLVADSAITYTPTLIVSYGGPFGENYFFTRENPHDDPKLQRFIPHATLDRLTRRRGNGIDPGPGGWFRDEEFVFRREARIVNKIVAAGGRSGVGSHGQLQGLGYHWELWMIQSGGMPEHEALRVATRYGAEAIGLDKDLGSLEAGKLADLVVLDANPLENIRHTNTIHSVMKNGRLYDAATLDETWPRQRKLEGLDWLGREPKTRAGVKGTM